MKTHCTNLSIYLLHPCCPATLLLLFFPAPGLPLLLQLLDQLFSSLQGLLLSLAILLHFQLQLLLSPHEHLSVKTKGEFSVSCQIL